MTQPTRARPLVRALRAMVCVLLFTAGQSLSACARHSVGAPPTGPWRSYPTAFAQPGDHTVGATVAVADEHGCFLGIGHDDNAPSTTTANWRASGDCTQPQRIRLVSAPPRRPDDRERLVIAGAVEAPNVGFLAVGEHVMGDHSEGLVLRGHPDNGWEHIADLSPTVPGTGHVGVTALAASPRGYLITGNRDNTATAWWSPDGTSWIPRPLPASPGYSATTATTIAVSADGVGVAVGVATTKDAPNDPRTVMWRSAGPPYNWQPVPLPDTWRLSHVVYDGSRFTALGSTAAKQESALVLTSTDGATWDNESNNSPFNATALRTAVGLPDGTAYAISARDMSTSDGQCASAWRRSRQRWIEEPLGCHGIPTSLVRLADGRIAAVGGSTLWLRQRDGDTVTPGS